MLLTASNPYTCLFTEMNKSEFIAALVIVPSGKKSAYTQVKYYTAIKHGEKILVISQNMEESQKIIC